MSRNSRKRQIELSNDDDTNGKEEEEEATINDDVNMIEKVVLNVDGDNDDGINDEKDINDNKQNDDKDCDIADYNIEENGEVYNNDNSNRNDEHVDIENDDGKKDDDDDDRTDGTFQCDSCLHCAIRNDNKSVENIMELIQLFPMEVQYKNIFGEYPLHTACCSDDYYHCDSVVVMKLLELYPEAAKCHNSSGLYPLHLALLNNHMSEEVIMKLIEIYPKAVCCSIPTIGGYGYSLHVACKTNRSEMSITKLIQIHPLAIQETLKGEYPIQYAIKHHVPLSVIKLLLDGDPLGMERRLDDYPRNFTGHVDGCGYFYGGGSGEEVTAMHLACIKHNTDLVKYLLQRSDLQINVRSSDGKTSLHYSCYDYQDETFDML